MFTRGYAKHPCKQIKYSQRVAVRPIRPYPFTRKCIEGAPSCMDVSSLALATVNFEPFVF